LVGTAGIRDRQDKIMNKIAKLLPTKLIIGILRRFPKWHQVIAKTLKIEGYWQSKELKNTFAKVVNQDLMSLLPKIKAPTLIIWGERDRILNPRLGKIYKNQISDSQLRIVWEAKHDPHLEKPEQFTEIVEDFLYD